MKDTYLDIDNHAGLASIAKFYREIKMIDKKVTENDVTLFLSGQDFTLCIKYYHEKCPRGKFLFIKPGRTLVFDVLYLNAFIKSKVPFILLIIDGYWII